MGQRLIININDAASHERLLSIYYHWSAYTYSAMDEVNKITTKYVEICNKHGCANPLQNIVNALQELSIACEAPLNEEEYNRREKELGIKIPDNDINPNRSDGLFCIDQKNMELNDDLAEGNVELNLEKDGSISLEQFNVQNEMSLSSFLDFYFELSANDGHNVFENAIDDYRNKVIDFDTFATKLMEQGIGICRSQSFILPEEGQLLVSKSSSNIWCASKLYFDIVKTNQDCWQFLSLEEIENTKIRACDLTVFDVIA